MDTHQTSLPAANPLTRLFEQPVRWLQIVMGWVLVGICLATTYEIIVRKVFGSSIQGINEIGAYVLAISSTWGFSMALLQRAHSRVDFLFPRFPGPVQTALNLIAVITLAALAIFSAWEGWSVLKDTLRWQARASTPLQTPLWIPQSLWLAGLVIFAGLASAMAVHAVLLSLRKPDKLNQFYGPPSLEEQIEIETQGILPNDERAAF